jgi:crotonobetainyl-CoA:carnitine CoA-transferase CaiB-like acyl-CoA transferase
VQARSGLMSSLAAEKQGLPFHSEVQAADYSTAILLFGGIAAALYARERTGLGQRVDASLLGGALALQNNALAHVYGKDDWRREFVEERLPELRRQGASHSDIEAVRRRMRPDAPVHTAHYRVFRTADGSIALGAGSPLARRRLAEVTGVDETLMTTDPDAFGACLAKLLITRTSREWVELLRSSEVPVAEVRHVEEMFFDPHVAAEGLMADYEHELVGRFRGFGAPLRMSVTPFEAKAPSPPFARHTVPILTELGFDPMAVDALCRTGAVVAGAVQQAAAAPKQVAEE